MSKLNPIMIALAILSLTTGTALASPAGKTNLYHWKGAGLKLRRVQISSTAWLYRLTASSDQKFLFVVSNKGHTVLLSGRCAHRPAQAPFLGTYYHRPAPGGTLGVSVDRNDRNRVIGIAVISANGPVSVVCKPAPRPIRSGAAR